MRLLGFQRCQRLLQNLESHWSWPTLILSGRAPQLSLAAAVLARRFVPQPIPTPRNQGLSNISMKRAQKTGIPIDLRLFAHKLEGQGCLQVVRLCLSSLLRVLDLLEGSQQGRWGSLDANGQWQRVRPFAPGLGPIGTPIHCLTHHLPHNFRIIAVHQAVHLLSACGLGLGHSNPDQVFVTHSASLANKVLEYFSNLQVAHQNAWNSDGKDYCRIL